MRDCTGFLLVLTLGWRLASELVRVLLEAVLVKELAASKGVGGVAGIVLSVRVVGILGESVGKAGGLMLGSELAGQEVGARVGRIVGIPVVVGPLHSDLIGRGGGLPDGIGVVGWSVGGVVGGGAGDAVGDGVGSTEGELVGS